MLTGKDKLYLLLTRIEDKRVITASGQPILIHPMGDLNGEYPNIELMLLFKKLQDDEKVLRVTRTPLSEEEKGYNPRYEDDYYGLELLPAWGDYFLKIQQEPEYQKFPPSRTSVEQPEPEKQNSITESDVVYKITYTKAREVLINDLFQLAKPNFDNENDLVFQFLYGNPNKKWTLKEIQEKVGNITKTLHKIVENLGFVGDFKKVFFDVSETAICFKNPITKSELEKLGIRQIRLPR